MKKLFITIIAALILAAPSYSQNVTRNGNQFTAVKTERKGKAKEQPTKTIYTYKDTDGKVYPIWMSAKGKCFIIRTSQKTGKEYRKYLPKVTEELNKRK